MFVLYNNFIWLLQAYKRKKIGNFMFLFGLETGVVGVCLNGNPFEKCLIETVRCILETLLLSEF